MTAFETTTTRLVQQQLGGCALIQDLLPLYIEGEVTPASRDLIAEHLMDCERCTGFLAGARSSREQLHRESRLRETSVAHDRVARQAITMGQRRVMAVVLVLFGVLCLVVVAGVISLGFATPASAPVPLPVIISPGRMP
jgi:predicted anti-sigma-YlaC factor YlaD